MSLDEDDSDISQEVIIPQFLRDKAEHFENDDRFNGVSGLLFFVIAVYFYCYFSLSK